MQMVIPEFCLIVVSGRAHRRLSVFLNTHFVQSELVDTATGATALVTAQLEKKLRARQLAVIDASRMDRRGRVELAKLAKNFHARPIAIVFDSPASSENPKDKLKQDGFQDIHVVPGNVDDDAIHFVRQPMLADKRREQGPFDIIGDVHGCIDELRTLLDRLGYEVLLQGRGEERVARCGPSNGRRAVFVGDLVDRGPNSPDVLRVVMAMVEEGHAFAVPGNHDAKFLRWLNGRKVRVAHGLEQTIAQFEHEPESFRSKVMSFLDSLVSHAWLAGGRLAVAHAGIKEEMMGRSSGGVRQFCLYGETSGETDEFGLPVRYNWATAYRGDTTIVYGHTPVPEAEWLNNTLCVDTGCVFGGKLTALRWPEKEIVSVNAVKTYVEPGRPLGHPPPPPAVL